jgi:hypothetical protein
MESIKPRLKEAFDNAILSIARAASRKVIDVLFSRLVVDGKSLYEQRSHLRQRMDNTIKGSELLRAFSIPNEDTNLYMLNEQGKGRLDDLLVQEDFSYHIIGRHEVLCRREEQGQAHHCVCGQQAADARV